MGIRRIIAYFADFILLSVIYVALFFAAGILLMPGQIITQGSVFTFYALFLVLYILYFGVLPYFWGGYTLFKKFSGLKVVYKKHDALHLLLIIVKYVIFRLVLVCVTFGLLIIAELIYMKLKDGVSFVDQLTGIGVHY